MKNKIVAFSAGSFLSLLFIYLLFRNIDLRSMFGYYASMNFIWLIPFTIVLIIQLMLRSLKWRLILLPVAKISFYDVFRIETAGLAINNILPFRIGEFARSFIASKMFNISFVSVFSTVILERIVDFLAMAILFASFSYLETFSISFFKPIYFIYIGFAALTFFIFMLFSEKIMSTKTYTRFSLAYPSFSSFSSKIMDGLKSFNSPLNGILILFISLIQWLCEAINNYIFAIAFGLSYIVNLSKAGLILCSTALGVSLPSAPGYFGNFEFAAVQILSFWGVEKTAATAYAWALHSAEYIIMTGIGIFCVYSLGYSVSFIFGIGKDKK